jgi:hypothetical protein
VAANPELAFSTIKSPKMQRHELGWEVILYPHERVRAGKMFFSPLADPARVLQYGLLWLFLRVLHKGTALNREKTCAARHWPQMEK